MAQGDYISSLESLVVLLISNGTAKTKLAILPFWYCGEFVKNSYSPRDWIDPDDNPVRYLTTTSLIGLTNLHLWKIPHCKTADKCRLRKRCFSLKPQHLIIKTFTRGHSHVLCTEGRRSPFNVHCTKRPI